MTEEGYGRGAEGRYGRRSGPWPDEMMVEFAAMLEKLRAADWANPDKTAEEFFNEVAKYDYQSVYSKLMTRCIMFWLSPEEIRENRKSGLEEDRLKASEKTERTFDVLWLAYERWMARGLGHYAEVATLLGKFYVQLRWGMALEQSVEGKPADAEKRKIAEKKIAEAAYRYLAQVKELVEDSYVLFEAEVGPMLKKLREINPEIKDCEQSKENNPEMEEGEQNRENDSPP